MTNSYLHDSAEAIAVAYLGPAGSFTGQAALRFFGPQAKLVSVPAHDIARQVRRGVERGGAKFGMIPVANIKHGYIENTFSSLYDTAGVQVIGEVLLPVEFHLLGNSPMEQIHTVTSHEAGLSQCRAGLDRLDAELGRAIKRVPATSTSAGVQMAAQTPGVVALGSMEAARQSAVEVLRTGMQDHPENVTHFWALGLGQPVRRGTRNKTLFLVELEPGTSNMLRLLQLFAEHDVTVKMFKEHTIASKSRAGVWSRAYFVECEGHISDEGLNAVYRALRRAEWEVLRGRRGRLLGSYPAFAAEQLRFMPRQKGALCNELLACA